MSRSLLAAMVVAAVGLPAGATQAQSHSPAPGGPSAPPGMEQMHELMAEGNPGMERMHELMAEGNPGMEQTHELMGPETKCH